MKVILATLTGGETLHDHGVSGISYTYSHPLSKNNLLGIIRKASMPIVNQFLAPNFESHHLQFRFNNPQHLATLFIHTSKGELIHQWKNVKGAVVTWDMRGRYARLAIVTVIAQGLPVVSKPILLP